MQNEHIAAAVDDGRTPHVKYYQYIALLFAAWRLQKKDILEELDGLLRRELCGVR